MKATRRFTFEAAHYLEDYPGKCSNLHGHSYKVEVTFSSGQLVNGMVVDFGVIKSMVNEELELWDHALIVNKKPDWLPDTFKVVEFHIPPTAENMAYLLNQRLKVMSKVLEPTVFVASVKVWETENCYAECS